MIYLSNARIRLKEIRSVKPHFARRILQNRGGSQPMADATTLPAYFAFDPIKLFSPPARIIAVLKFFQGPL